MKDLVDIPKKARNDLKLVAVEHMDQVLEVALQPMEKPVNARRGSKKKVSEDNDDAQNYASDNLIPRDSGDTQQVQPGI